MGHVHADLMRQYAEDAAESYEPYRLWQIDRGNGWEECVDNPVWRQEFKYRRKPRTIRVGEYDVPEPMRDAPTFGSVYYIPVLNEAVTKARRNWTGEVFNRRHLERGLCHSTREAAELHAKALISLTEVKS